MLFFIALVLCIVALVIVVPKLGDVSMLMPGCPCLSSTALCCNFSGTGTLKETRVVWLVLSHLFCMTSVFPSNVSLRVPSQVSSARRPFGSINSQHIFSSDISLFCTTIVLICCILDSPDMWSYTQSLFISGVITLFNCVLYL